MTTEAPAGRIRRAWAALRRHWLRSWAGALALVVAVAAWFAYRSYWWIGPYPSPLTVTVAGGCPTSTGGRRGVRNDGLGFRFEMAPKHPTGGLVCVYNPNDPQPSPLLGQLRLDTNQASQLAADADEASTVRPAVTGWACSGTDHTLIALSYLGRSDVDLWIDGEAWCDLLTNGRLITSNPFEGVPLPSLHFPSP